MTVIRYKQHDVPVTGGSIRLRVAKTEGVPCILMHGGPGGTDYLSKFIGQTVADSGYQPVGMIQRGSPGSPGKGPFTVEQAVEDLDTVRRYLEADRIALLGHSWGGFLSTAYAAMFPEVIERLTIVCPMGVKPGWRDDFHEELVRRIPEAELPRYDALLEEANATTDPEKRAELMVERARIHVMSYYSPAKREGQPGLAHLTWQAHEQLHQSAIEWVAVPDWEMPLRDLSCPCTLIYGEDDPMPQHIARDYNEILPNLNIHMMTECGHFPFLESPDEFLKLIEESLLVPAEN